MLGGVATQLAWPGETVTSTLMLMVSASVKACRIFFFSVFLHLFHHHYHFFHDHDEWHLFYLLIFGLWLCLWPEGQFVASQLFSSGGKKCLLVSLRGYCMLHGRGIWSDCCGGAFPTLLLNITRLLLGRSFFFFLCVCVCCVTRLMHDGSIFREASFGNETAVRSVVSFLMLQKNV